MVEILIPGTTQGWSQLETLSHQICVVISTVAQLFFFFFPI